MDYKLGKLPAKVDKRTIKLSSVIRKKFLPELPPTYDIDFGLGGINDQRMFGNDQYGCCVISARAHQTLRFEKYEAGVQPKITDQEVINQYLKETGGPDTGLYLLESLKSWRKSGWAIGDKTYNIYAFASINWKDHEEVKRCIHLLGGVNFGMLVFERDIEQFEAGEGWELTPYSGSLEGGHGVYAYAYGYNDDGITCMTWGKRQYMSWDFWDARVDEAYGIVDNRNEWVEDSPVDVAKLDNYLNEITSDEVDSTCHFANGICNVLNSCSKGLHRKSRFKAVIWQ
jgi:hypothetical protein